MTLYKNTYRIESTRLRYWDYASAGWYFVTVCTQARRLFLGDVQNNSMILSPVGKIAHEYWQAIPQHSAGNIKLDMFVVMPNHVHGIIIVETLQCNVSTGRNIERLQCNVSTKQRDENDPMSKMSPQAGSLGVVVRSYKSAVSRWCNQNGHDDFGWHPRFYDHIIRDELLLEKIRQYIADNPIKWDADQNHPENLWM